MSDQYTPTTEEVRNAYIEDEFGIPRESHLIPGFERWLASVQAEAWEQGKRAEEKAWIHAFDGHPVEEGDMCDQCSTDNPYRETGVL